MSSRKDDREMQEIDDQSNGDDLSERGEIDSGHASENGSDEQYDDSVKEEEQETTSASASMELRDLKDQMKKKAKERLRKCVVFMSEFWKIILFLLQAGLIGGLGLLAYYMKFTQILPLRDTLFDCDDPTIQQHMNSTVYGDFAFGKQIKEEWMYVFSWMAPPGMTLMVEFFYSLHTGCALSPHLKTPLILRRVCRIIGVQTFGQIATLVMCESIKIFITTPRPYFLDICKPNSTDCHQANQDICSEQDPEILRDARTSFPSMPVSALSYACFFVGAYLHQMVKHGKAFVLQPFMALIFVTLALLGGGIEVGITRSHWWDVLGGYALGITMAAYMAFTLNYFVEKFPPKPLAKLEDTWIQTDPEPEPESDDEYPYEEIMAGKLPRRRRRHDDRACFHRATSFDSSFQSDLARSMNMFKSLQSAWADVPRAPVFDVSKGFYEQPLPAGLTTLDETQTKDEEEEDITWEPPLSDSESRRAKKNWNNAMESTLGAMRL